MRCLEFRPVTISEGHGADRHHNRLRRVQIGEAWRSCVKRGVWSGPWRPSKNTISSIFLPVLLGLVSGLVSLLSVLLSAVRVLVRRHYASVRLQVTPKQAEVYLDGYYVGVVDDFDGVFQRLDTPTGQHELQVYMQGYKTLSQNMLFRPGQTYKVSAVLQPLAPGDPPEPRPVAAPRPQRQYEGPPPGYQPPQGEGGPRPVSATAGEGAPPPEGYPPPPPGGRSRAGSRGGNADGSQARPSERS